MSKTTPLILSPDLYAKLRYMCANTENEVAGWGYAHDPEHPMQLSDIFMPPQYNSVAYVEMDDDALNKYLISMMQKGHTPEQTMRVWIHTHPGSSATPSSVDWNTLRRLSSDLPWASMFIMSKEGSMTCNTQHVKAPRTVQTQVLVDYGHFKGLPPLETSFIDWGLDLMVFENAIKPSSYMPSDSPLTDAPSNHQKNIPMSDLDSRQRYNPITNLWGKAHKKKTKVTPSPNSTIGEAIPSSPATCFTDGPAESPYSLTPYGNMYEEELDVDDTASPNEELENPITNFIHEFTLETHHAYDELHAPLHGLEDFTLIELFNLNRTEAAKIVAELFNEFASAEQNSEAYENGYHEGYSDGADRLSHFEQVRLGNTGFES